MLCPDPGFAKTPLAQEKHINSARALLLRELLVPALCDWMFEWKEGTPGLLGHPTGLRDRQLFPTCQSLLDLLFSLSGCLSSPGTLPQADLTCCQQEGPPGALSKTGWGCAAVVASCLCCSHSSPAWELPQSPAQLCPQAFLESPGLQLASLSLLSCSSSTQSTKGCGRAPGRHQARQ